VLRVRDGRLEAVDGEAVRASLALGEGRWRVAANGAVGAALGEAGLVVVRLPDLAVLARLEPGASGVRP
jgi:hypothetical protein